MEIKTTKIEMEHIPRTIFGIKFNKRTLTDEYIYNQYVIYFTEKEQSRQYNRLIADSWTFSEVKKIKWLISPEINELSQSSPSISSDIPDVGRHDVSKKAQEGRDTLKCSRCLGNGFLSNYFGETQTCDKCKGTGLRS